MYGKLIKKSYDFRFSLHLWHTNVFFRVCQRTIFLFFRLLCLSRSPSLCCFLLLPLLLYFMVDLAPIIASIHWLLLFLRWLGNDCSARKRERSWEWCKDMIDSPGQCCNSDGNERKEIMLQQRKLCPRFSSCQNDHFSPQIIYLHKTLWDKSWYPWTVISFLDLWPYTDETHAQNSMRYVLHYK